MQFIEWQQLNCRQFSANQMRLISKLTQFKKNCRKVNNINTFKVFFQSKQNQLTLLEFLELNLQSSTIAIKSSLFDQKIQLQTTKIIKLINIRVILKLNSKMQNNNFLIHPITGEICIHKSAFIPIDTTLSSYATQNVFQLYVNISNQNAISFEKLKNLSSNLQKNIKEAPSNKMSFRKQYIYSSNKYAWNILQGSSTKNVNEIYYDQKTKFKNCNLFQKKSFLINQITSVLNQPIDSIQSINILNQTEDKQLKQHYLQKTLTINRFRNSQQIQEITVPIQAFEYLLTKKEAKINCHELGAIRISIKTYPRSRYQSLKYQRKVLQHLPGPQFIGLPKYYFVKNIIQSQNQLYRFTNLTGIKQWENFIQANRQTFSMYTSFSIFNQFCVVLRYLRDANIVYHNLRSQNIVVRKGLTINFINMQNSYCCVLNNTNNNIKNYLPYVSNFGYDEYTTITEEKSDVYSFGILAYQILFKKTPNNIKQHKYKSQKDRDIQIKLSTPSKFCIENIINNMGFEIFKPFIYLIFMCLNHQMNYKKRENQSRQKNLLKQRPYLDWVSINTRIVLQYLYNIK